VTGVADRRADHETDAAQRPRTRVDLRNLVDDGLRHGPSVGRHGVLDGGAFRVGGQGENEHAAAVRGRGVERRLQ
jgi:hypothetical protein